MGLNDLGVVPMWTSPLAMGCDLDPKFVRTPALELINAKLTETLRKKDGRLLLSIPPQEGKSTLVAKWGLIWGLWLWRRRKFAYVSYELTQARDKAAETRDALVTLGDQIGMRVSDDTAAKHYWKTTDGGSVYSVGIGGPLTGRHVDVLIVDDPFKDMMEADSEAFRRRAHTWWETVGSNRLAPGAPVVVIQTRWHEDDMIGWLQKREDGAMWDYLNIPAQADHNPAKGQTDPLGREPGEYMVSARRHDDGSPRTAAEWDAKKRMAGPRAWAAMFQGSPAPGTGKILLRQWWRRYDVPLWIERADGTRWVPMHPADEMLISVDCSFKDHKDSDYVAIQVWMRRGVDAYLLDQVHDRMDFTETTTRLLGVIARWPQAHLKLIEDAANGPAVIAALRHKVGGIVPETPQGSKRARAYATTPYLAGGNIFLPESTMQLNDGSSFAWVDGFIEEAAVFDNGDHDDRVDAYTQAVNRLLINPFVDEEEEDAPDDETMMADLRGWSISPG